jgi:Pyruvate/2-oxoacid:ferredoxin oxidoreductase gamma subunit
MPTTTPRTTRRAGSPRRTPVSTTPYRPSLRRRKPEPQGKGQQLLAALTSAVPAGKAASKAKSAGAKTPTKGLALLGAAGGVAAFLKSRSAKKAQADAVPVEPVSAPAVTSVPEPSAAEVRADGTL